MVSLFLLQVKEVWGRERHLLTWEYTCDSFLGALRQVLLICVALEALARLSYIPQWSVGEGETYHSLSRTSVVLAAASVALSKREAEHALPISKQTWKSFDPLSSRDSLYSCEFVRSAMPPWCAEAFQPPLLFTPLPLSHPFNWPHHLHHPVNVSLITLFSRLLHVFFFSSSVFFFPLLGSNFLCLISHCLVCMSEWLNRLFWSELARRKEWLDEWLTDVKFGFADWMKLITWRRVSWSIEGVDWLLPHLGCRNG